MLKFISLVFLFFSIYGIGFFQSKTNKKAFEEEYDFQKFIDFSLNKIKFFSSPTYEIIAEFTPKTDSFGQMMSKLNEYNSFECFEMLSLSEERKKYIYEFFNEFGSKSKNETVEYLEYCKTVQTDYLKEMEKNITNKTKSKRLISLCIAVLAVILFI